MAEISETCEFVVPASTFIFTTECNGDRIVLSKLSLNQEQAASLTWLINLCPTTRLHIEIKQDGS